jgi:16S rRNA (adenine1518-N6/adenine1519-N6)-dimethyltransferase
VYLAERAQRVVAVELDDRLIPPLQQVIAKNPNVQLVQGDILGFDPAVLMRQGDEGTPDYIVVANIPYYITSALIRHLLECASPPERLALTVQNEVAERICAAPGSMSLLALSVQVYGAPHIAARIPAGAFYPPPKVDSAVIRVDRYSQSLIPPHRLNDFFRLAKAGFSQKRKTLRNALAGGMRWDKEQAATILKAAGIDPMRRAETLGLEDWKDLTDVMVDEETN